MEQIRISMSWNPSSLIFHLLLVSLLTSHILVDANAIDCTFGWSASTDVGNTHRKASCYAFKGKGPDYITYNCGYCGRSDGLIPSAWDCVNSDGRVMNGGKAWACDQVIDVDEDDRSDGRQILCEHTAPDGTVDSYNCKKRHVFQQCARDSCEV